MPEVNLRDKCRLPTIPFQKLTLTPVLGLPRPVSQYPNTGSPWHPGCIERCFCPDLAKRDNESLARLCKYTNSRVVNVMGNGKHSYSSTAYKRNHYVDSASSSESSIDSHSGTDVICVHRSGKENQDHSRTRERTSRVGRLGACERYSAPFQLPRGMIRPHRMSTNSPNKHVCGGTSWCPPPPQLLRSTIQVSLAHPILSFGFI